MTVERCGRLGRRRCPAELGLPNTSEQIGFSAAFTAWPNTPRRRGPRGPSNGMDGSRGLGSCLRPAITGGSDARRSSRFGGCGAESRGPGNRSRHDGRGGSVGFASVARGRFGSAQTFMRRRGASVLIRKSWAIRFRITPIDSRKGHPLRGRTGPSRFPTVRFFPRMDPGGWG